MMGARMTEMKGCWRNDDWSKDVQMKDHRRRGDHTEGKAGDGKWKERKTTRGEQKTPDGGSRVFCATMNKGVFERGARACIWQGSVLSPAALLLFTPTGTSDGGGGRHNASIVPASKQSTRRRVRKHCKWRTARGLHGEAIS